MVLQLLLICVLEIFLLVSDRQCKGSNTPYVRSPVIMDEARPLVGYLTPRMGAKYCDECVCCLFICPLAYLRNHTAKLHQIFVHVAYGHGWVI